MTADATEHLDLELSNKLHSSTPSDTSSTIKNTLKRKYRDFCLDIRFVEITDNKPQCIIYGKAVTVFDATDKVEGFKKKLKNWAESIKTGSLDCFSLTKGFGEELESVIPADILNEFEVHRLRLIDAFNSYFPRRLLGNIKEKVWVVEPCSTSKKPSSLSSQEYECLLDLTSDTEITSKFETEKSISDFCVW
ncbi:hypothetical protein AVEN_236341-1 [Araneus ventricosus]|uniref:Uncharacterized protein n=1 Tax=Araneus ventricosus TaxID=182803 RepID=A0A4Y2TYL3_ARAVE|nr:hypothetical protein AVEN_236341-1 [Araneus ventricosus]